MTTKSVQIVYDGECPVCQRYTQMVNLRRHFDTVELINAREKDNPIVRDLAAQGYDFDKGMVLKVGDSVYFGADAMHTIALLATPSGLSSRMTYALFGSKSFSRAIYPALRSGRLLLLKMLGRGTINP